MSYKLKKNHVISFILFLIAGIFLILLRGGISAIPQTIGWLYFGLCIKDSCANTASQEFYDVVQLDFFYELFYLALVMVPFLIGVRVLRSSKKK